jgi:hypothetical protein
MTIPVVGRSSRAWRRANIGSGTQTREIRRFLDYGLNGSPKGLLFRALTDQRNQDNLSLQRYSQ